MTGKVSILLVEDSADYEITLARALRQADFEVELQRVADEPSFLEALETPERFDLIICDYALPGFGAAAALRSYKSLRIHLPLIVVSDCFREGTAVATLKNGAYDYLLKSNLNRLPLTVLRALREREVSRAYKETEWISQRIFAHSQDVILVLDTECRLVRVSDAGVKLFGKKALYDTQASLMEHVHPDEKARVRHHFEQLAQGMGHPDLAFRVVDRITQETILLEWSCSWSEEDGCFFAIGRDITETDRQRQRQQQLTEILDATPDLVGIFSPQGLPVFLNQAAKDQLGIDSTDHSTALHILEHHAHASSSVLSRSSMMAANAYGYWTGEISLPGPDGVSNPMSQTLIAHKNDKGDVHRYSTILHDISAMKRLEEKAMQAGKMEAVGQLAGGVAHDFNNLLTVIAGHSALLGECEASRESAQAIQEACDRATSLTRQLLSFSRKAVISPQTLDLNKIVREAVKMLNRLISVDITLDLDLAEGELYVNLDPGQLNQVIMNLCINSRDAMPKGGVITLRSSSVKESGSDGAGRVIFSVADTGVGIPPSRQKRIFDPFFTTKGMNQGTGMGLSVVHGIVEQNAGSIRMKSIPGHGTTFEISLPRIEKAPSVPAQQDGQLLKGSETILLAEDEPHLRALASTILRKYGYQVYLACDAVEALEIAKKEEGFDLLITDVVMPGMSGAELATQFSEMFPATPVLYMSGYTDDEILRYNVYCDEVEFLQKPFTPKALLRKARSVLGVSSPMSSCLTETTLPG